MGSPDYPEPIHWLYAILSVYGAEAVLPTDIQFDAPRVALYTETEAKEAQENDVDLLEEARELTLSWSAIYQQSLQRYHSRKIRPRVF